MCACSVAGIKARDGMIGKSGLIAAYGKRAKGEMTASHLILELSKATGKRLGNPQYRSAHVVSGAASEEDDNSKDSK